MGNQLPGINTSQKPVFTPFSFTREAKTQAPTFASKTGTAASVNKPAEVSTSKQQPTIVASKPAAYVHKNIFSSVGELIANIAGVAQNASAQRAEDKKQGLGIFEGAKIFSNNVDGFLGFLQRNPNISINSVADVGEYAKAFMQEQASASLMTALGMPLGSTAGVADAVGGLAGGVAQASGAAAQPTDALGALGLGDKIVGYAGAAYSIYQILKGGMDPLSAGLTGASTGAYIGSAIMPGAGTVIGAVIGGIGGLVSGLFKSGKPKDQKERDQVRKAMQQAGILDQDWQLELANGAKFDFGKDGGSKLQNLDGTTRRYKELDSGNQLQQQLVQLAAPLAIQLSNGNSRLAQELANYFTNAATSNTNDVETAYTNLKVVYGRFGMNLDQLVAQMQGASQAQAA